MKKYILSISLSVLLFASPALAMTQMQVDSIVNLLRVFGVDESIVLSVQNDLIVNSSTSTVAVASTTSAVTAAPIVIVLPQPAPIAPLTPAIAVPQPPLDCPYGPDLKCLPIVPLPAVTAASPFAFSCSITASAVPAPHGGGGQPYMAGWEIDLNWGDTAAGVYNFDKNASINITWDASPNVYTFPSGSYFTPKVVVTNKARGIGIFNFATATSTTFTLAITSAKGTPTSCSTTIDLTDQMAQTGIPLETVYFKPQ